MLPPTGGLASRNPVGVEIAEQSRALEKDKTREPDRGGAAQDGKKLLGGHRLRQKEQECAEKDGDAVEKAGCGHCVTRSSRGLGGAAHEEDNQRLVGRAIKKVGLDRRVTGCGVKNLTPIYAD